MCISFPPYFDHDAFMHHPMHVLDAPDIRGVQYLAPLVSSVTVTFLHSYQKS